jgi:hypothetical protein
MNTSSDIVMRASWALRWFAYEFFSIAIGRSASAILTSVCRVLGVGVMLAVARIALSNGLTTGALAAVEQCVFVGAVAVLLGNLVKESAIDLGARVLGWSGRDFSRSGATLQGKVYRETLYADGTWIRCESGPDGTVCEWTDRSGVCNRIETRVSGGGMRKPPCRPEQANEDDRGQDRGDDEEVAHAQDKDC